MQLSRASPSIATRATTHVKDVGPPARLQAHVASELAGGAWRLELDGVHAAQQLLLHLC